MTDTLRCPVCGEPADPSHLGCEACGADLHQPAAATGHWLSSAAPHTACTQCGRSDMDEQGFCDNCGKRQTRTSDRIELDMSAIGAATDFGKRHKYNQDALAIGRFESTAVAVVCDGVSSSTFSELASLTAAEAAVAAILDALAEKRPITEASHAGAVYAAQAAAQAGTKLEDNPPSCTYVSAIVTQDQVHVTWVGDSRAYWVSTDQAVCLTVDDSHVGRLAAANVPPEDERYHTPYATALLSWLGADAPELRPNTCSFTPPQPGILIVCSDGLSCYLGEDTDLLPLLPTGGSPVRIAAELTQWARDRGGRDNISVIAVQYPPHLDAAPAEATPAHHPHTDNEGDTL